MSAIFTWRVIKLECVPSTDSYTNVVRNVHWECVAKEDSFASRDIGVTSLPAPGLNGTPFVDYTSLSESQVLQWVWNELSSSAKGIRSKNIIESKLQESINRKRTPPIVAVDLPWPVTSSTRTPRNPLPNS